MRAKRQGRILLIEDEAVLRELVAQFLRAEGHEVVEAEDGVRGVERFSTSGTIDLVLLDLNLPLLPGVEVCRRIKQLRPAQPVIICSAAILEDHCAALDVLEVTQFLSKPYHPAELLCRVNLELLRAQERSFAPSPLATLRPWRTHESHPRTAPSHTLVNGPVID
jgi:DNA-binding response OmpR family regulator